MSSNSLSTPPVETNSSDLEAWMNTLLWVVGLVLVVGFPAINLIHPSPHQRSLGFWHSLAATVSVAVFVRTGAFALGVLRGTVLMSRVRRSALAATITAMLSLVSGLRAFARYKAPTDDGAGVYLRAVTPLMQSVMTWHWLISFSIFSLAISSFFICWLYGDRLLDDQRPYLQIRAALSLCLGWILLLGLSTFAAGVAVAKVHAL